MLEAAAPYHEIPLSRQAVLRELVSELQQAGESPSECERFRALSRVLGAVFHHEFHERLEALKEVYEPFDPDRSVPLEDEPSEEERAALAIRLEEGLVDVLERGNYRRLTTEEIDYAMRERSLFPLHIAVDFSVFDQLVVYARGETLRKAHVRKWFGLRRKLVDVVTYDRVCMFLRFKTDDGIDPAQRKALSCEAGVTMLKLFRNIPKADLEMLFPNTQLKMRLIDKLLIGVPAVVGGVPVFAKLVPALVALAILIGLERGQVNLASVAAGLGGLVGLGLFLFRQWDKFKSRKLLFFRTLSDNLYFLNIDNNEGVITRLVDEAEEEEHKEALLAYHFLRQSPGLSAEELDRRVESWLEPRFPGRVNFHIDDALAKLERLELARAEDGRFEVVSTSEALERLGRRWKGYFGYHR